MKAGDSHAAVVARCVENIFRDDTPPIVLPIDLIGFCFNAFECDVENKHRLFGLDDWLNAISLRDPDLALDALERYLVYVIKVKPYFYDYENKLAQLMTTLFSQAEEREEMDRGEMLSRVVSVQDSLLSLGVSSINDWLKSAERQ